jgi:ribosomal protein L11 methyltransferase
MPWIQIRFETDSRHSDTVEEAALEAGALAVTFEDKEDKPIFEPPIGETPLWEKLILTALFDADIDTEATQSLIQQLLGDYRPKYKIELLEDKDWEREWIKNYHPMCFGDRLWICPSWTPPPEPDAINLMLDPGLAFGTGTHPTTALCLKWLDQAELKGKTVVDFGCGSGILAIAALLLGAEKVIAIDIDPQALEATVDNAERNQIPPAKLETYLPEDAPAVVADLVLANILAGPLLSLKDTLCQYLRNGGELVLSGLLENQADDICAHYSDIIDFQPSAQEGDWMRLSGSKH